MFVSVSVSVCVCVCICVHCSFIVCVDFSIISSVTWQSVAVAVVAVVAVRLPLCRHLLICLPDTIYISHVMPGLLPGLHWHLTVLPITTASTRSFANLFLNLTFD